MKNLFLFISIYLTGANAMVEFKHPQYIVQHDCSEAIQKGNYVEAIKYFKQAVQMEGYTPFCRVFRLILDGLVTSGYIQKIDMSKVLDENEI